MLLYAMYYIKIYAFTSTFTVMSSSWQICSNINFPILPPTKACWRLSSTFSSLIGEWHVKISTEIWRLFHFIASFNRLNLLIVRPSGRPSLLAFTSHVTIVTFCLICSFCVFYIIKNLIQCHFLLSTITAPHSICFDWFSRLHRVEHLCSYFVVVTCTLVGHT